MVILSDQHAGGFLGSETGDESLTPALDALARAGTRFSRAYTCCPLCVPARAGLLSGKAPHRTGVYTNLDALPQAEPTFLHALSAAGYDTVLCGRMHFMGSDQRHGFARRIFGDITPGWWGCNEAFHESLGAFGWTTEMGGCLRLSGEGDSPVLAYDREVTRVALEFLRGGSGRPFCLVVGLYGPHFPYVAPPEYFRLFLGAARTERLPELPVHPAVEGKRQFPSPQALRSVRAAYRGMVRQTDELAGRMIDAFFSRRARRPGVAVYLSDHGDQAGERGLFGKQTFYEGSTRVPLIAAGTGVARGRVYAGPVSLLDIGPTLCGLAGVPALPERDGRDLSGVLRGGVEERSRAVEAQFVEAGGARESLGRMVVRDGWKLITYSGYEGFDELYHLDEDPGEANNLAGAYPALCRELGAGGPPAAEVLEGCRGRARAVRACGFPPPDPERWNNTVRCAGPGVTRWKESGEKE